MPLYLLFLQKNLNKFEIKLCFEIDYICYFIKDATAIINLGYDETLANNIIHSLRQKLNH